ncbi:YqzL family protein [Paenibacillus chartarius]|uniref:YqzL family protein n=1 Tax=Paenibacillus chartarius TaxID=747481 RepID=A0ABV6DHH0_9BACL
MRDFSWNVFTKTGDVDAYLLYKQSGEGESAGAESSFDPIDEAEDDADLII